MKLSEYIQQIKNIPEDQVDGFINNRIQYLTDNRAYTGKWLNPSSYPRIFNGFLIPNKAEICVDGWGDYTFVVDDLETIYKMVVDKIKQSNPKTLKQVLDSVTGVVYDYIGGCDIDGDMSDRFKDIVCCDDLPENEKNKLSNIKGKKHAYCVERSIIAHEVFCFLGIRSEFVYSPISVNGQKEIHAFNIIKGKTVSRIYDTTMIDFTSQTSLYETIAFAGDPKHVESLLNIPSRTIISKSGKSLEVIYNHENKEALISGNTKLEDEFIIE